METQDDLLCKLAAAKKDEEAAKKKRLAAEDAILARIANKPEKGRVKLGEEIRCTIEFKLNVKANVEAIRQLELNDDENGRLPINLVTPAPYYEFDERAYEALRTTNPKLFAKVAQFVETKPAKPAFELKL